MPDWLKNALGVATGSVVAYLVISYIKSRREKQAALPPEGGTG